MTNLQILSVSLQVTIVVTNESSTPDQVLHPWACEWERIEKVPAVIVNYMEEETNKQI